jgi:hypothetical protein
MISGCTDCRLAPILYDRRGASKTGNDLRFSGYHRARAQGPGKCHHLTTCMRILLKETYVPDTSTEYELPA